MNRRHYQLIFLGCPSHLSRHYCILRTDLTFDTSLFHHCGKCRLLVGDKFFRYRPFRPGLFLLSPSSGSLTGPLPAYLSLSLFSFFKFELSNMAELGESLLSYFILSLQSLLLACKLCIICLQLLNVSFE
jgi:hypothetical protein